MTDSGTKYAWVIHESKAVQMHVHNNRRCDMYLGCLVALYKSVQQQSYDINDVRVCARSIGICSYDIDV